jgi:histidinol-phosphate aminotransferase
MTDLMDFDSAPTDPALRRAVGLVRPEVRAQKAYKVPTTLDGAKLDQNESPSDVPDEIKEAILSAFAEEAWNRYPDDRPHRLVRALEEKEGLPEGSVIVGRGSNELTHTLGLCFVSPGTPVVLPHPMFALYESVVKMYGGDVVSVDPERDLSHRADAILQAAKRHDAALTIVTTPNNPTGQTISPADLDRLAEGVPGILVVDEAYHEFVQGQTATDLLKKHANVLVLRTFSKALGMAGLRIGVMLGRPALIQEIEKSRLPFLVDRMSERVALALLERSDLIHERVKALVGERERLEAEVAKMDGVEVIPGEANFFLFRTPMAPSAIREAMAARGVRIRDVSGYQALPGFVRVSVGLPDENRAFLEALQAVLAEEAERAPLA